MVRGEKDGWPIRYDYIIHDVFTGGAEPLELFTMEFLEGLYELLKPGGAIAIVSPLPLPVIRGFLSLLFCASHATAVNRLPVSYAPLSPHVSPP